MPTKNKKSPRLRKSKMKNGNEKRTAPKKAPNKESQRIEMCRTAVRNKSRIPKIRKKESQQEEDPKTKMVPTRVLTWSFPIVTRSMIQRYRNWLQSHFGSGNTWIVNQLLHPEMYGPTSIVTRSASRKLTTDPRQSDSPTGQSQLIPETSQHFSPAHRLKESACGKLSYGDDIHLLSLDNTHHPITPLTQFDSESIIIDDEFDDSEKHGWLGGNGCTNQSPCTREVGTVQTLDTTDQNSGSKQQNPVTTCTQNLLKRDVSVQTDRLEDVEQLLTSSTHNASGDSDNAMEEEIQNPESSGLKNQFLAHDRGEQIFNQESGSFNNSVIKDRRTDRISNVLHFDRSCPSVYSHSILADFSTPTSVIIRMDPAPEASQHQMDLESTLAHLRHVLHSENLPGLELDKFKKHRS